MVNQQTNTNPEEGIDPLEKYGINLTELSKKGKICRWGHTFGGHNIIANDLYLIIIDIYKHCSPALGAGDREFKSLYPDSINPIIVEDNRVFYFQYFLWIIKLKQKHNKNMVNSLLGNLFLGICVFAENKNIF